MASNMAKVPLMRSIIGRGLASAAARAAESDIGIESSTLGNKLQVLTIHNNTPLVRVSVSVKAGSRYESSDNLGAAHVLRSAAGLTTKNASTFAITRTIQERGANLYAVNDRDSITYTLECRPEELSPCLRILHCVTSEQVFKPWELSDNLPRIKLELAQVPAQARVIDMLHGAAYRTGLGNSLFIPKYLLGAQSSETMQHFVKNTFLGSRTVVCGSGLPHAQLADWAERLSLQDGAGLPTSSTYYGGELRKRGKGLAHIAVATEGAGVNKKEALAFGILQHALGKGPATKWGVNSGSALAKAVESAAGGETATVSALNASHQDSGLFGVVLTVEPKVAGKVLEAALKVLKSGSVPEDAIKRGKAGLKASILMGTESGLSLTEEVGQQALLLGSAHTPTSLAAAVDSVSSADVSSAAKKVASGKLSLAAMGDISHIPFLDQMK